MLDVKILPLDILKRARKPINIPVVLAPNEVHQILFHTKGLAHLMLSLMYGTGMRISEVLRLRIRDIDFEHYTSLCDRGKD